MREIRSPPFGNNSVEESGAGRARPQAERLPDRRTLLKSAIAVGLTTVPGWLQAANNPQEPRKMRPQSGDRFVYASGEKEGTEVRPDDLQKGAPQILTWPMEPATKIVRDGSLLNHVLLSRFDPADLDEDTKANAADGIVAYSGTCTHAQCPITGWNGEKKVFNCQCHQSEFDPRHNGKVVFGPAPRLLPALPLKIENGALVSAGTFLGRVGTQNT